MEGEKLDKYLKDNFEEVWARFNVLGTGWVEIE